MLLLNHCHAAVAIGALGGHVEGAQASVGLVPFHGELRNFSERMEEWWFGKLQFNWFWMAEKPQNELF